MLSGCHHNVVGAVRGDVVLAGDISQPDAPCGTGVWHVGKADGGPRVPLYVAHEARRRLAGVDLVDSARSFRPQAGTTSVAPLFYFLYVVVAALPADPPTSAGAHALAGVIVLVVVLLVVETYFLVVFVRALVLTASYLAKASSSLNGVGLPM